MCNNSDWILMMILCLQKHKVITWIIDFIIENIALKLWNRQFLWSIQKNYDEINKLNYWTIINTILLKKSKKFYDIFYYIQLNYEIILTYCFLMCVACKIHKRFHGSHCFLRCKSNKTP